MKTLLILFLSVQTLLIRAADTVHVVTHNRQTVVTNPAKGFNLYKAWGRFHRQKNRYGK